MSLRPEELLRKIIQGAGYRNPPSLVGNAASHDEVDIIAKATVDLEFGDWVEVASLAEGHLTIRKPTEDGGPAWVGVVTGKIASGAWGKVRTAGAVVAKVDGAGSMTAGDTLEIASGQTYAVAGGGANPCGRFLKRLSGSSEFSWVHIGSGGTGISIHHHKDDQNTKWTDTTDGSPEDGYSWHLFRVDDVEYTGNVLRLCLAIGGNTTHGESNKEGFAFGGVIGVNAATGVGQMGGNESAGKQGVLGIESTLDAAPRVNIRSFAGVNARDRYPLMTLADCVGPIRYTKKATNPKWRVSSDCDTDTGCPAGTLFWGGTMRPDTVPAPSNATSWAFQWTPQFSVERDCCSLSYSAVTGPEFPCGTVSNPEAFNENAADIAGSYEWIIPYGYVACANRLTVLEGICNHGKHIQKLWQFLFSWGSVVDSMFACIDAHLVALGRTPCCGTIPGATVSLLSDGPGNAGDCAATVCD